MARRPTSWRDVVTVNPNQPRYRPGGLGRYESSSSRRSRGSGGRRRRGGGDDTGELLDNIRRKTAGQKLDDGGGLIDDIADVGKGALSGIFAALDTGRAFFTAVGSEAAESVGKPFQSESDRREWEAKSKGSGETFGFSVADVIKKTRGRETFTKQTKLDQEEGFKNLPAAAQIGIGITADVVTDPVSYIAPQAKLDDVARVARDLDKAGDAAAAARVLKARTASVLTSDELAKIGAQGGVYARVPGTGVIGRTLKVDRVLEKMGVPMRETQLISRGSRTGRAGAAASRQLHRPIAGALNSRPAQRLVRWGLAGGQPQLKAMLRSGDPEQSTQALRAITEDARGRYVAHGFESRHGKSLSSILKDAKKANVDDRDLWLAPTGDPDAMLRAGESGSRLVRWLDDVGVDANNTAGSDFLKIHEDYTPRFVQDEILDAVRRGDERTVESIVKKRKYGTAAGEKPEFMGHDLVSREVHPKGWSVERQIDGILFEEGITKSPRKSGFYKDSAREALPLYLKKLSRQVGREHTANELKKAGVGADLFETMRGPRSVGGTSDRLRRELDISKARRARVESEVPADEVGEWAQQLDEASGHYDNAMRAWLDDTRPEIVSNDALIARTVAEQASGEISDLLSRHSRLIQRRDSLLQEMESHYTDAAAIGRTPDENSLDALRQELDSVQGLLDDMNATVAGIDPQAERSVLQQIEEKLGSGLGEEQKAIGSALRAAQLSKIQAAEELVADPAGRNAIASLRAEQDEILETIHSDLPDVTPEERTVLDTSVGGEPLSPEEADLRARFEASTDPEEQVDLGIAGQITRLETQAATAEGSLGAPLDGRKAAAALSENEEAVRKVLQNGYRQFGANTQLPEHIVEGLTAAGRLGWDKGQGVLRLYDNVQNLWKSYAVATPGFHFRNSFGGVFNNYLAGVNDIGSYRLYRKLSKAAKNGTLGKLPEEQQRAWAALEKAGIAGTGQTAYEIEHRLFASVSANPLTTDFAPVRASRRVGEEVENNLRGTLFLHDYLRNGEDATEAFNKVMKFHFDYEDLSGMERSVVRRIVPFYTWTRRNLPLQLEMIAKQPAKMNRYWQAKQNIEATSEEEGVVPPYYEDLWAIRLPLGKPTEEGGAGQMYLTPDLPETQLGEILDPGMLIGQGSPILKTPIEYWAGKQFFKDLPLSDEYEPAPGIYQAIPGLMEGMKLLGRAERNADGQWMLKERDAYAVGQALPLLSQARRVLPSEDRYEDRRMSSMLSYFFGVGTRTNTESEQQKVLWQRYYELDDQLKEAEKLGYVNTDPDQERVTVTDLLDEM